MDLYRAPEHWRANVAQADSMTCHHLKCDLIYYTKNHTSNILRVSWLRLELLIRKSDLLSGSNLAVGE